MGISEKIKAGYSLFRKEEKIYYMAATYSALCVMIGNSIGAIVMVYYAENTPLLWLLAALFGYMAYRNYKTYKTNGTILDSLLGLKP